MIAVQLIVVDKEFQKQEGLLRRQRQRYQVHVLDIHNGQHVMRGRIKQLIREQEHILQLHMILVIQLFESGFIENPTCIT